MQGKKRLPDKNWQFDYKTRRERLKSALYLRLNRRKVKIVKGGPFRLFQIQFVAKYQKKFKGDPLATKKFEQKKGHSAEKIQRGTL